MTHFKERQHHGEILLVTHGRCCRLMDGEHICLAHYQQTASGTKHSKKETSAPQSTKNKLSISLMSSNINNIVSRICIFLECMRDIMKEFHDNMNFTKITSYHIISHGILACSILQKQTVVTTETENFSERGLKFSSLVETVQKR